MNDAELDALLAAAAPIDDADLADLPLSGPDTDLCEAIMSTPVIDTTDTSGAAADDEAPARPGTRRRRLRPVGLAAAGAAAAALVAAVAVTGVGPFGADDSPAWAAEAEAVADSVPRLLLTAEGWELVDAPQFVRDEVALTYRNAEGDEIFMVWNRDAPKEVADELAAGLYYESTVETYALGDPRIHRLDDATVADQPGVVFSTELQTDVQTLTAWDSFSDQGDFTLQISGFLPAEFPASETMNTSLGEDDFREVLASIESVDVDTWLAAMPHDVTTLD